MKVSVIVPTHNGKHHMKNCLETWLNQDFPKKDFEIIIIDNDSSDGGYKIVQQYKKKHKNIRLIRNKIGRGYSGGGNQGVELAKGDNIIISNDDIFVEKNWINLALKDLQEPGVGATHGLIYFYKTKKFSYRITSEAS